MYCSSKSKTVGKLFNGSKILENNSYNVTPLQFLFYNNDMGIITITSNALTRSY